MYVDVQAVWLANLEHLGYVDIRCYTPISVYIYMPIIPVSLYPYIPIS
jgi:hypothetical protein